MVLQIKKHRLNFQKVYNEGVKTQQIFEEIKKQIDFRKDEGRPFVIGINGVDTSGKTEFTIGLNNFLIKNKYETQIIHIDDFHNPKAIRYSGNNQAESYYHKSFNITTLIENLLLPIQQKRTFMAKLQLLSLESDKYDIEKEYRFTERTIVLLEGVFIYRKELKDFIDYKIFIHIPIGEVKKRAMVRDMPKQGNEVMKKYDKKYIPAQEKYLQEYPPETVADLIIDNTDWRFPKIKFVRQF